MKKTEYTCDWCKKKMNNDTEYPKKLQDIHYFLLEAYKLDDYHLRCLKKIKQKFDEIIK
jgi:hypothetical protein